MAKFASGGLTPAFDAVAITKSDVTVFPVTRAIYVGGTGDVAVRTAGGNAATFLSVPAGIFWVQVDQVLSTGTDATGLIALY